MAQSLTVLIAGGTGMIGSALTSELLADGHTVAHLSRSSADESTVPTFGWKPATTPLDLDEIARQLGKPIDAVVNLAGATISKMPWTKKRKQNILTSRVDATMAITDAIGRAAHKPTVLINGSAVGIYGDRDNENLTESSARGHGFLADVVQAWESAALTAPKSTRVVLARTGLVLGEHGALGPITFLTKLFVSGPLAGGKDWWPWISLRDEARALAFLITTQVSGPVNLVAPQPATSATVMRTVAQQLKRPFWLPAPGFAISLLLGQAGRELLLSSQKVHPEVLLSSGFTFLDTEISGGVRSALG